MKNLTAPAATTTLSLDEFVARLAARPEIAGILLFGSTATPRTTPTSDLDLLVVFESLPASLRLVLTWVEGRLTEVYCTTTETLTHLGETGARIAADSEAGASVNWLRSGRIVFDRTGTLSAAQETARTSIALAPPSDDRVYEVWRGISYNVLHAKRYLAANEPTSAVAVEMRLLYSLADVMTGYFTVRRIRWQGEKAAVRYWMDHDPDFLSRFRACLAETNVERKVERYEGVARLVLAPVGELWAFGTTAIALGPAYGTEQGAGSVAELEEALKAWDALTAAI